jgi:rfaE bifunctional protein nucleotidyltransferase chain/domain
LLSQKEKLRFQLKSQQKRLQPKQLEKKVQELKKQGNTIVTVNGSFDLLHAGHLQMLYEASLQGDILIVALNTDASIRGYKSEKRPIIELEYRLQMMSALEFVDYVTWFDELDPRNLLQKIKPHVHVNGSEYGKDCLEATTVIANGGKMHIVKLIDGLSTSKIIEKIKTCE